MYPRGVGKLCLRGIDCILCSVYQRLRQSRQSQNFQCQQSKVCNIWAFVAGFRGDWKALKQSFNMNRYADRDQVQGQMFQSVVVFIVPLEGVLDVQRY